MYKKKDTYEKNELEKEIRINKMAYWEGKLTLILQRKIYITYIFSPYIPT